MKLPSINFRSQLLALFLALVGTLSSAHSATVVQTFFVPLSDTDLQTSWQAIGTGTTIGNSIKSVISIAVPKTGTIIYYDHWEDGYDATPNSPVGGSSTLIWGDGNTANGTAPGYPTDIIPAGGVIVLNNNVTLPRSAANIFYDARDRISTSKTIAVAHAGWPISPGTVIGTAVEAYDTRKFGTAFQMPVGTNTDTQQQFEYSSIHIMASQDNTLVQVDRDANGSVDVTQTINTGQTVLVSGGVLAGATVNTSKPVEVHEITGDIGSNYESRSFAVRPTSQWSSSYYAPVGTTSAAYPHVVYLYNPGITSIVVSYEGPATTGTITVPAKGNGSLVLPLNSAIHFFTAGGEPFYAVGANDAGTSSTTANQTYDWGYALTPDSALTTSLIAPWAPGSDDLSAPSGVPDANGSPVWVTPTATTTVYVNYSGDVTNGPNTAPDGSKYDVAYNVAKLTVQTIENPTTFDMSKSLIFTTDGTRLAGAWGENPATAGTGAPYLDLGYAIIPFAAPLFSKTATLSTDVNSNGQIDPGDTVLFTLFLNNDGVVDLPNAVFTDAIPAGTTYVPGTTFVDGTSIPDDVTGTPFPMDGSGVAVPFVPAGNSVTIKFRVSVNSGTKSVTNTAQVASSEVPQPILATVSFSVSPVGLSGNVYNDANGLLGTPINTVDGAGTNAGGTLYANLVSGGVVLQVNAVSATGTYNFINVPGNNTYSVVLSTTIGAIGGAAPAASLPSGYANTGEKFGTGAGSDGTVDGVLSVTLGSSSATNANFGIEQTPTANNVSSASQRNPSGIIQVTVPTLTGSDPEDASITSFKIETLPTSGILYYNGLAVTAGQTISAYNSTLLKFDPNDGAFNATFTYSAVDAAGKSGTPAAVTMPFTTVGISGNVFNDANGTTDNIVNGTGTNLGGVLYANLVSGTTVAQVLAVASDGTYSFLTVPNGTYSVVLSTTQGTVGNPAPSASLPAGWLNTAEKLGTGNGNDGNANGAIAITVNNNAITNANFGIERPPTAISVTAPSQVNPGGNIRVAVPTIGGTDPEDASIITVVLNPATNGTLRYNGNNVNSQTVVTNFNPALLLIDPANGNITATFTYTVRDAAGIDSPAATVTMPFSTINITGNVYNDANGLLGTPLNTVDGTGTNAGGTLYANLINGGVVDQTAVVSAAGAYTFTGVAINTTQTIILSTTQGTVGNAAPAAALPAGYVNTGENVGATAGSDGTPDGTLSVTTVTTTVTNANFGIERTPTANNVSSASQVNPAGTAQVTVPTLTATDPEDSSITSFKIVTLPANGTLYYNGTAVTLGQTISSYNSALLKLDPNDGAITATFTYSAVDAAGKTGNAGTVTMPFTTVGVSGNVYNDANGLLGTPLNTVDGVAYSGTTLYANLISGGNVAQVATVTSGAYNFVSVAPNISYTVVLSTTQGVVGSAAPAAALPAGYVNTGENIGAGAGNDGTANGSLAVTVVTTTIANANFGVERPPTVSNVSSASQINPAGTAQVVVPTLTGTDAEDGASTSFTITSLPANGTLYYNNVLVTLNQTINSYNAALMKVDPNDGAVTVSFNYTTTDAAGRTSAARSVTMPFTNIGISGNVYNDANGLLGTPLNTVDGVAYSGSTLYANLISGGNVSQVATVVSGAYSFGTVAPGTAYTVVLSTTQGIVGNAAPAAALPSGYVNTGENIGSGAGSDGTPNGSLAVTIVSSSIINANFGVERTPTANNVSSVSQINPAGIAQVTVPTLTATDPEDSSVTSFKIETLPTNGTLYYNGSVVTLGQTIASYNSTLLKLDPNDGTITVTFTYSAVDAAGKTGNAATVTMPFTNIGISGNIYNDTNALTNNLVDGTGTNLSGTLYANLISGGNVAQVVAVSGGGTYSFGTVAPSTTYTVLISTTQGVVGNAAPAVALPAGFVNTGEKLGTGTGSDGLPNGQLTVATTTTSVTNANFGIRAEGALTGRLYVDSNGNGTQNGGEPNLANVNVVITDSTGYVQTVVTNSSGNWTATVPIGSTSANVDETDTDFTALVLTGYLQTEGNDPTTVTALAGQSVNGGTDGYFVPGSISGSVLIDTNNDNIGDQPLSGVTVTLKDLSGNDVDSDPLTPGVQPSVKTTNVAGAYTFTNVPPGSYRVFENQPSSYGSRADKDGGNKNIIGDVSAIVVTAGQTNSGNTFVEFFQECPDAWTAWQTLWPLGGANGPTDNPDGDGNSNLIEYAFCLPPNSGVGETFCVAPSAVVSGGVDGMFMRTRGGPLDVTYVLQYAANLGNPTTWSSITLTSGNTTVTDNGDGSETVVISNLETLTGLTAGKGFVRIRVNLDSNGDTITDATDATVVHGWRRSDLTINCRTYNNPFLDCSDFSGTINSVTGQTLNLATSAGGFDLAGLLDSGVSYYLEVVSGANQGQRFDVVSASGNNITIANDASLTSALPPYNTVTGAAPSSLVGNRVILRNRRTLASLFPIAKFTATALQTTADMVQTYLGGTWQNYWLFSNGGSPKWVAIGDSGMTDRGTTIIPPGEGAFITCRQNTGTLLAMGEVRSVKMARPLAVGASFVGGGYPVNESAASRALTVGNGFYGNRGSSLSDQFLLWKNDTTPNTGGYVTYFLLNPAPVAPVQRWVQVGDATLAAKDAVTLLLDDRSIFLNLKFALTSYIQPCPWTP